MLAILIFFYSLLILQTRIPADRNFPEMRRSGIYGCKILKTIVN